MTAQLPHHERLGAAWELQLQRRFEAGGWQVQRHPVLPGSPKRPDLLVQGAKGARCYVEATVVSGFRAEPAPGGPATSRVERFQDVLLSRLTHKSRSYQGIDAPLLLAVLALADHASDAAVAQVLEHGTLGRDAPPPASRYPRGSYGFFSRYNEPGRNVSAVLVACGPPTLVDDFDAAVGLGGTVWHHPFAQFRLPPALAGLSNSTT